MNKIFITGGAGFIGSAVIRFLLRETNSQVLNLDKLTYAGNHSSLDAVQHSPSYVFVKGDASDGALVSRIFQEFQPQIVMHFAAETHVDRSIDSPCEFIQSNIVATFVMLECARKYVAASSSKHNFKFHHISTDEVYGSLNATGFFTEETAYNPSSPYSASKASSDHLVRAWHRTYGLPVLITNCSNNYGPYQFPEKLIPLMILNALEGSPLPIYGNGQQVRDWLYVDDHARALYKVVTDGRIGQTYNIGGNNEKTNIAVVEALCDILDDLVPSTAPMNDFHRKKIGSYRNLITFVKDRPGHDQRYAINASKIQRDLGWIPQETLDTGLRKTVQWYIENLQWCKKVQSHNYERQRLGLVDKNQMSG